MYLVGTNLDKYTGNSNQLRAEVETLIEPFSPYFQISLVLLSSKNSIQVEKLRTMIEEEVRTKVTATSHFSHLSPNHRDFLYFVRELSHSKLRYINKEELENLGL